MKNTEGGIEKKTFKTRGHKTTCPYMDRQAGQHVEELNMAMWRTMSLTRLKEESLYSCFMFLSSYTFSLTPQSATKHLSSLNVPL